MASKRSSVVKLGVFPSTGFVLDPVLDRSGLDKIEKHQRIWEQCSFCLLKPRKIAFFCQKWTNPGEVQEVQGTPSQVEMPKVHPPKSRSPRYTHTSRNLHSCKAATDPTDPTKDGTSGCHNPPVVVKKVTPVKTIKTSLSLGEPSPAAAKRQRVMASKLRASRWIHPFFFEKITIYFQTLLGSLLGVWRGPLGVWEGSLA